MSEMLSVTCGESEEAAREGYRFTVIPWDNGKRLDIVLATKMTLSRVGVQRLIEGGNVSVNEKIARLSAFRLRTGDQVLAVEPPPEPVEIPAQKIALDVLYEDGDLIVVNKPQGMVVHPAAGHDEGTLVNALMDWCGGSLSGINGELRPGIVHRIDKDTSGALVCAKNDFAHISLAEQLARHEVTRLYRAVATGVLKANNGTVDAPLGRSPRDRKKFAVVDNGKRAITHWKQIERLSGHSLLECKLETGRTHQIRVHMSYIGHPIAGDPLYGKRDKDLCGQALHAAILGFKHPRTNIYMQFSAPDPDWFASFVSGVRLKN